VCLSCYCPILPYIPPTHQLVFTELPTPPYAPRRSQGDLAVRSARPDLGQPALDRASLGVAYIPGQVDWGDGRDPDVAIMHWLPRRTWSNLHHRSESLLDGLFW